jgi:arginyl-tRNA synthetase
VTAEEILRTEVSAAAEALGAASGFEAQLERPRDPTFGDWATNAPMVLARVLRRKPLEIANDLVARLNVERAGVSEAYVAGAGFINFRLADGVEARRLREVLLADATYGASDEGAKRQVNVEFVSANPTGPLHVGHGRQAALGDAIASLLTFTGWVVTREFYYNDAGVQIANLTRSVQARVRELRTGHAEIPEGGYHGEYIKDIARDYVAHHPDDADANNDDAIQHFAVAALRAEQDADLQAFGVRFDVYYLESSLYEDGRVERTVDMLREAGQVFEDDGALWLRTTAFGDDKDRVMRKRDGTFTYFVPDVAYHINKWERGFARAINVQGADHHSTVTRVRAGLQALEMGIPEGYPEYELHQMVTVMRAGEEMKISKRAGSYVTIRELVDETGRDAVRYFLLMRKADSPLVFDIELARSQSDENPVYYVQMAHARVCGIFRVGGIVADTVSADGVDFAQLSSDDERELVKQLLQFPSLVATAARMRSPHLLVAYLHDTAGIVHKWYHKHHVLGEADALFRARLVLARAAQIVLRNGLGLLGVTAPERM